MQLLVRFGLRMLSRSRMGLGFAAVFALVSTTFSATFTASLDRNSIVLGEQVTLTLEFKDGQPQEISNLPHVDGLRIASSVNQQTSMTINNGAQSTVFSYTVTLEPTRVGEFVIPPFRAKVNGQILESQAIALKVAASDSSAPSPGLANKLAFLWISLPKTNLFINEPMVAEFRIYLRSDVHRYGNLQLSPDGNGLTFGKFVEGQQYQRRVGGAMFTVVPFSVAITPVKTGMVSINPINGSILLNNPDPMDFGGFFGPPMTPQQVALTSQKIDLESSPLPSENVPPGFNGAVGSYTMSVTAGPTNVVAGDPVTLHIQISGHGALDSLVLPEQAGWANFKIYPPTSKVNASDQLGIDGSKTFEEIVTPQNSDIRTLPPVTFSFFDPDQKRYRTLTQGPIALLVRAATPGAMPAVANAAHTENATPPPDIIPIKQHIGVVVEIRPPLVQQTWFLTVQGVPALALICSVIWRKRKESLENNPRLRRQRQVAQLVREGLGELRDWAAQNKSDEFFATLFRLLQEQLGERLDFPASSITEAVIEDQLRPRGVSEEVLAPLQEMFQMCNLARYALIKSSQELAAIVPKLESLLNQLRELTL